MILRGAPVKKVTLYYVVMEVNTNLPIAALKIETYVRDNDNTYIFTLIVALWTTSYGSQHSDVS